MAFTRDDPIPPGDYTSALSHERSSDFADSVSAADCWTSWAETNKDTVQITASEYDSGDQSWLARVDGTTRPAYDYVAYTVTAPTPRWEISPETCPAGFPEIVPSTEIRAPLDRYAPPPPADDTSGDSGGGILGSVFGGTSIGDVAEGVSHVIPWYVWGGAAVGIGFGLYHMFGGSGSGG